MAERIPKTLKDLAASTKGISTANLTTIVRNFDKVESSARIFKGLLEDALKFVKTEKQRLEIVESIKKEVEEIAGENSKISKYMDEQLKAVKGSNKEIKKWAKELVTIEDLYNSIVKQNQEIFNISHKMQLESNLTWKQYTQVYNAAFDATRQMNKEMGQSLANAKDMINTQNALLGAGFKNINLGDLTKMSSSVYMMQKTLGAFPQELAVAFQQSYRQFGAQTDQFVTSIGNRLNAFSNTFGVTVGMLTSAVAQMQASNSFLFRNNMQAQTLASENLIKAAALSGAIGLGSSDFITKLAGTSQFGTMQEMSSIYQGGALLQGFDTANFQGMMQGGQYDDATKMLFTSIADTLGGIEDQYLRAEYMQRIGSSFGLGRDELLLITQNAEHMDEYISEMDKASLGMNTSMVDELSDLKVAVVDRLSNWWTSTGPSQGFGKAMQDLGLVGLEGQIKQITGILYAMLAKDKIGSLGKFIGGKLPGGSLGGLLSSPSSAGAQGIGIKTIGGSLGAGLLGAGIGVGGNVLGRSIQTNTNMDSFTANAAGGITNIGSGIAGGAMIGSVIPGIGTLAGGIIGGVAGGINTLLGAKERKSAMQDLEDERRAKARSTGPVATGDPIVDAINGMNANLTNVLNGNFSESRTYQYIEATKNKTVVGV